MLRDDTVAAISTPPGVGGIGIIRISGPDAFKIGDAVFSSLKGKKISEASGYTAIYGNVHDSEKIIDEAIALVFHAPASYTGEDVVELSMHGGIYILKCVLRAVVSAGARLAEGGEFTRRAFENGKIDLAQAESVMNLINASGESERLAALNAREGKISQKINQIKNYLLHCASDLAAYTDYPDEDIPDLESGIFLKNMEIAENMLQHLLDIYDTGKILREGIDTVIVGKPNVGKSTLMNLLAGENRSIVTSVAGTTRDIVEESVMLGEIRLKLSDTAGIRDTDDIVEKIGVDRSRSKLESSQLVLIMLDSSELLTEDDFIILDQCRNKNTIVIINKTDLQEKIDRNIVKKYGYPIVSVSAKDDHATDIIYQKILEITGILNLEPDAVILSSERQRCCATNALKSVREAISALESGITMDAVGVCLDDALYALMSLTGEKVTTAVADDVFARFCVGK